MIKVTKTYRGKSTVIASKTGRACGYVSADGELIINVSDYDGRTADYTIIISGATIRPIRDKLNSALSEITKQ